MIFLLFSLRMSGIKGKKRYLFTKEKKPKQNNKLIINKESYLFDEKNLSIT